MTMQSVIRMIFCYQLSHADYVMPYDSGMLTHFGVKIRFLEQVYTGFLNDLLRLTYDRYALIPSMTSWLLPFGCYSFI